MKKLGFATVIAGGLTAAVLGLAGTASAATVGVPAAAGAQIEIVTGIDHHSWLDQITPDVNVPKVDTSVRHSGR